jgi:hypothetical protein
MLFDELELKTEQKNKFNFECENVFNFIFSFKKGARLNKNNARFELPNAKENSQSEIALFYQKKNLNLFTFSKMQENQFKLYCYKSKLKVQICFSFHHINKSRYFT